MTDVPDTPSEQGPAADDAWSRRPRHGFRPGIGQARTAGPLRAGIPTWVAALLGASALVGVILAIGFGTAWSSLNAQNNEQATVRRVSSDFLLALTNFRPNTVYSDFRTIAGYATGAFAKQSNQFFGSSIRQRLQQAQAQSQGQIRYVYIQSLQGSQAAVYGEIYQTYANNKVTTPITDVLQVVLDLSDTSTGWKISAVTVLQPPASPSARTGNAGSAVG
ncbi:MAG: hypothetical protein ACYDD6_04595 [Acidimicrobiales bacterium]